MTMQKQLKQTKLRKIFNKEVVSSLKNRADPFKPVAVALSSGIDSRCILFSLLSQGFNVTAYSFHIDEVESRDFVKAKEVCQLLNVPFVEVKIPKEVDLNVLKELIETFNLKKKTDIECLYCFYFLREAMSARANEDLLYVGLCSDTNFVLSKSGMMHHKHSLGATQMYREEHMPIVEAQVEKLRSVFSSRLISIAIPFSRRIYRYFYGKTWDEVNRPFQKHELVEMFPEYFNKIRVYNHTNLQCGDSQIREVFESLLKNKSLNKNNRKRVVDLYRDLYNESHKSI